MIAMALPITSSVLMAMDGDGGMALNTPVGSSKYVFKPVNMQALWYVCGGRWRGPSFYYSTGIVPENT